MALINFNKLTSYEFRFIFKLIIDRGIFDKDLIPLDVSRKEVDGAYGSIRSREINGRPKAMTAQAMTLSWYPMGASISQQGTSRWNKGLAGWRGQQVQRGLAWSPRIPIHGNILNDTQDNTHYPPISLSYGNVP